MTRTEEIRSTTRARIERGTRLVESVVAETGRCRIEAEQDGRSFTAPPEDQLLRRATASALPMIVWQSWNSGSPGSTIDYRAGVLNPGPDDVVWVFGHVFVGAANVAPEVGAALAAVDPRFPRLTEPAFAGLTIKAGSTETLQFGLTIPAAAEKTNYMGNLVLYRATWHDPAEYLDRSLFVFAVS
jgi:hypothetical protein